MIRRATGLFAGCVLGVAGFCSPAVGAIFNYQAMLTGAAERPTPVVTNGTGQASIQIDDALNTVTISGTFQDLSSNSTNAHLHGLAGTEGTASPLFALTFDVGVTAGTFSGMATLSASDIAGVLNGLSYINVHSSTFGGGEIRGQVLPIPEPVSAALLGLGGLGLMVRRRRA